MTPAPQASSLKDTAKRVLDRHPVLLKHNRVYHTVQRYRAYRNVELRPELTDQPDLLTELDEKGIVVLPGYMAADQVAELLAASEATIARAEAGEIDQHVFHSPEPGVLMRIEKMHQLAPATNAFFDDPMIRGVFEAYLAPGVPSYRRELDYRYTPTAVLQSDLYHFDNWRPICKAFIYLTEVTEDQAPFVYLQGSHKPGRWRYRHELAYDTYGWDGPAGCFLPQEVRRLKADFGWEDRVCTGPAGTLLLADFRGLHRGTPLRNGRRILLNNTFDLLNPSLS
jgi:hypothetical protein